MKVDRYCGGHLDKPVGTIKTPNWPDRDYPPGVTCLWHIVAPQDQVTLLKSKFYISFHFYSKMVYVSSVAFNFKQHSMTQLT